MSIEALPEAEKEVAEKRAMRKDERRDRPHDPPLAHDKILFTRAPNNAIAMQVVRVIISTAPNSIYLEPEAEVRC